ncbi:S8 family serine peptidase [Neobacillus rhizophilus]|uniref:S8 family serine peptidase n=1 Tax=Neobacillus rhizophilus TaxID=2833579 RepID=A0A942U3K6_9BACI|nr:S8 family serine peptidase [Neobacillus rhizophilus]MBS4214015.1 S8 family serine peptidase [Neobacillus rhizophilus]
MKKVLVKTMLSVTVGFGIVAGGAAPSLAAENQLSKSEGKSLYVIAFKNELPKGYEEAIKKAGGRVVKALPEVGGIEAQSDNPAFLSNLKKVPSIEVASKEIPLALNQPAMIQNTAQTTALNQQGSLWEEQWDTQRVTNNGKSYEIETGGYENEKGETVHKAVVGVIDTGIDPTHPDLQKNLIGGRNLVPAGMDETETGDPNDIVDRNGHGTHVSGIIAANGNVKGVGPDLGIRTYRVFFSDQALTLPSFIIDGIIEAANDKVDVINMSLRLYNTSKTIIEGETYKTTADTLLWKRAIQYALKNDVTVVAGSGNESLNLDDKNEVTNYLNSLYEPYGISLKGPTTVVPAQMPGVINVSASNKWSKAELAFYSNYGNSAIDVAAPGGDFGSKYAETFDPVTADFSNLILSTWPTYLGTPYNYNAGTSMATPQVAGIAGVIKAAHPELKPSQVSAVIKQTAIDYGKPGQDAFYGSGEANAYRALMNLKK